jgi:hypothetical protein
MLPVLPMWCLPFSVDEVLLTEGPLFQGCSPGFNCFEDCIPGGHTLWLPEMI